MNGPLVAILILASLLFGFVVGVVGVDCFVPPRGVMDGQYSAQYGQ